MRMDRERIPQQSAVGDPQAREHAVHDGGACLGGSLESDRLGGCEWHSGLASTLPAWCFADDDEVSVVHATKVSEKAIASLDGARPEVAFRVAVGKVEVCGGCGRGNCAHCIKQTV
jgi:hypothetical protein